MAQPVENSSETRQIDSESDTTWTDNLPVRQDVDVLAGKEAGIRSRKYQPQRLMLTPAIMRRFLSKVDQRGPNECWPWMAGKIGYGYGQFNAGRDENGRQDTRYAHRVAFQIATGIDPQAAVVMHSCDNTACCNPAHLTLGTQAQNVADASRKGKYLRGLTVGSVRWKRQQKREQRRKAA